jgi:hypothetical protein
MTPLLNRDSGKVEEHECVSWSPNQEWIFRSIKVKPYFPSKDELNKKPLRPDETLAFEPQDDSFSPIPFQPNGAQPKFPVRPPFPPSGSSKNKKKNGKHPVQIQRPGPMVINPGEPFPPVFPYPILPKVTPINANNAKKNQKPPVPQVRHPGPLPFPAEPVVLDPKKPTVSPLDTFNVFAPQQYPNPALNTEEQQNDEEDGSDEDQDDHSEEGDSDEEEDHGPPPPPQYLEPVDYDYVDPKIRNTKKKQHEAESGVKYSDYRLRF